MNLTKFATLGLIAMTAAACSSGSGSKSSGGGSPTPETKTLGKIGAGEKCPMPVGQYNCTATNDAQETSEWTFSKSLSATGQELVSDGELTYLADGQEHSQSKDGVDSTAVAICDGKQLKLTLKFKDAEQSGEVTGTIKVLDEKKLSVESQGIVGGKPVRSSGTCTLQ